MQVTHCFIPDLAREILEVDQQKLTLCRLFSRSNRSLKDHISLGILTRLCCQHIWEEDPYQIWMPSSEFHSYNFRVTWKKNNFFRSIATSQIAFHWCCCIIFGYDYRKLKTGPELAENFWWTIQNIVPAEHPFLCCS